MKFAVQSVVIVAALTLSAAAGLRGAPAERLALVTVVADQSRAAAGLTAADFTITEDKEKVQVVEAVPARDPLSVILLVDTALPADGAAATPEMRRALLSFVSTLQAGDPAAQIAIYQVANAAIPVQDFTASRAELESAINKIASGTAPPSAMLEGVEIAAKRVGNRPAPRRAIVCVGIGTAESTGKQAKQVGDAAHQSGATLWVVSVQNASDAALTNRDAVWTRATVETGGLRQNVVQATRLDSRLQVVANSLLSQYFLKMVRKGEGAVKPFSGRTAQGSEVLFTRWMR